MRLTIPGNLLLFGEYAITLEGGKGIAVATDAMVHIEATPSDRFSIKSKFQGKDFFWDEGESFPPELRLIETILRQIKTTKKFSITIDSSEFYTKSGRKKGFGSSAAVTVGLVSVFGGDNIFSKALALHKTFQGGRGSGYDIAASLWGGVGLFTGGAEPTWHPIHAKWVNDLFIAYGDAAASTKGALKQFETFQKHCSNEAKQFFQNSNHLIDGLLSTEKQGDIEHFFQRGTELNLWLHEKLGIPAEKTGLYQTINDYNLTGCSAKPLGAGFEIGAIYSPHRPIAEAPLIVSKRGLLCKK